MLVGEEGEEGLVVGGEEVDEAVAAVGVELEEDVGEGAAVSVPEPPPEILLLQTGHR